VVSAPPGTAVHVTLADPGLESAVLASLAEVEARLHATLASEDPLVGEAARHLVDAGGKRFRPLLVALAAQLGDPRGPRSSRPPPWSS
jgi:Geranylgeranyl pyrophosphate synthase